MHVHPAQAVPGRGRLPGRCDWELHSVYLQVLQPPLQLPAGVGELGDGGHVARGSRQHPLRGGAQAQGRQQACKQAARIGMMLVYWLPMESQGNGMVCQRQQLLSGQKE